MSDLRNKLIRLAHSNPELRADLLPLIKEAAVSRMSLDADVKKQMNLLWKAKGKTVTIDGQKREIVDVRSSFGGGYTLTLDKPLKGKTSPLYDVNGENALDVRL